MKHNRSLLVFVVLVAICGVMVFPARVGRTTGGQLPTKPQVEKVPAQDRTIDSQETVFAVLN